MFLFNGKNYKNYEEAYTDFVKIAKESLDPIDTYKSEYKFFTFTKVLEDLLLRFFDETNKRENE